MIKVCPLQQLQKLSETLTRLHPLHPCLFNAQLEYRSSDSCRVIHCGQCNLSPDVLVGRAEEAPLINGGTMKIRDPEGERSHSASLTLRKYNLFVLHPQYLLTFSVFMGNVIYGLKLLQHNILLHIMHSFGPSPFASLIV